MSSNTFESIGEELQLYPRNDAPPRKEIEVGEGETRRIDVGSGETLTNTKIDITAPGAAVDIVAHGSDWEISHIAVVGKYQNHGGTCITASVPDPDGSATIHDVYLGDGNAASTALTVAAGHTGVLDIVRVCVRAWRYGIDCSPPGNPEGVSPTGAGGSVRMGECFAADIDEWAFRFGSEGSLVRNCTARDGGRCFWERWQKSEHTGCNARGVECWFAGNPADPKKTATVTAQECRGTGAKLTAGPGVVEGDIGSDPDLAPPDACPTTTDEALLTDDELTSAPGTSFGPSGGSGGPIPTGPTDGTPYYTGARLKTSNYGSLQAAINDAAPRDTVVVDANHTVSSQVDLKSDIKLEGGGGVITQASGTSINVVGIYGASNLWVDGIEIDGNRANTGATGGYALGGPGNNGALTNVRITNCHIHDAGGDGIHLEVRGDGTLEDVYVGGNLVDGVDQHGLVFGANDASGSGSFLTNTIIEGNEFRDIGEAQGIGHFGHNGGVAHDCALIGNTIHIQNHPENKADQAMSFEQRTHHMCHYGNEVYQWDLGNCSTTTKEGHHNVTAHNYYHDGPNGAAIQNFQYFEPGGPPENNIIQNNHINNCDNGIYYSRCNDNNVVYNNRIENCGNVIANPGSPMPRVFQNNGSGVGGTGLPGSIGKGFQLTTPGGQVGARASWSRGGPHPDEPVQVSVETFPERY